MVNLSYEKKIHAFAKAAFCKCNRKERKQLTEQLIDDMHLYLEAHPDISFDILARHFSDSPEPFHPKSAHRYLKWIFLCILALILVIGAAWYISSGLPADNRNIPIYTEESAP